MRSLVITASLLLARAANDASSWKPAEIQVLGPFCYGEECFTDAGTAACKAIDGVNIAGVFCLTNKNITVLGPFCSGDSCYKSQGTSVCNVLVQGNDVGGVFCLTDKKKVTLMGPFCSPVAGSTCLTGAGSPVQVACGSAGGATVGAFCLVLKDMKMLGPFCHDGTCYGSGGRRACTQVNGIDVNGIFCIVEPSVDVLGPFCYGETCYTGGGRLACNEIKGADVDGMFCLTRERIDVIGPFCHTTTDAGPECYTGAGSDACYMVGGVDVGGAFCLDRTHSLKSLGPFCYGDICSKYDGEVACTSIRGVSLDGAFCLTKSVSKDTDFRVLGPFCAATGGLDRCYSEEGSKACNTISGTDVGGNFCLSSSENATALGPFCYGGTCYTGGGKVACEHIAGANIAGVFCLDHSPQRKKTLGPFCSGTSCYKAEATEVCKKIQGEDVNGLYCLVTEDVHVLGPFCRESKSAGNTCWTKEATGACNEIQGADLAGVFCVAGESAVLYTPPWALMSIGAIALVALGGCILFGFGAKKVSQRSRGASVFSQHASFLNSFHEDRVEMSSHRQSGEFQGSCESFTTFVPEVQSGRGSIKAPVGEASETNSLGVIVDEGGTDY